MDFADKLMKLRREKGLSQEMLADLLDVSRQAVSKWEAGRAMPDIQKLVALADLFDVSLDELLRDKAPAPTTNPDTPLAAGPLVPAASLRREYKSKARLFGIPLVHVCLGRFGSPRGVARGIIAIGDIAIGLVAFGGIALGGLCLGGLSFGLLLALGGLAIGGFSLGGVAIGFWALGGIAIGLYSLGGVAVAGQVAGGGLAVGNVAVGGRATGEVAFTQNNLPATLEAFQSAILQKAPGTSAFFIRLLYLLVSPG